jgi:hypothetical protein
VSGASGVEFRPTGFITVALGGRWYALVVEPSPTFRYRGSAADCPILPAFWPFALAVSGCAVGREAIRGFQQFTR